MRKYLYTTLATVIFLLTAVFTGSCSDDEDFPNKPNKIDIDKVINIIPINGGLKVAWTPDPLDENFVFLNVRLTDQDNQARIYNVSRYGSNLVTPVLTDKDGNEYLNPNEAVMVEINKLMSGRSLGGRDPGYITRLKVEGVTPNCFWKAAEKWLALA